MRKQKFEDLITRDADGLLSPREKRQLDRCLAKDPDLADLHRQAVEVARVLDSLRPADAPSNLPSQIMDEVRAASAHPGTRRRHPSPTPWLLHRQPGQIIPLRLTAVIAAAAIVLFVTVQFTRGPAWNETDRLTGTLPPGSADDTIGFVVSQVEVGDVRGQIEARLEGARVRVISTLLAGGPVSLQIAVRSPQDVNEGSPAATGEFAEGSVEHLSHPGDGIRLETLLPGREGAQSTTVVVRVLASDGKTADYSLKIGLKK